MFLRNSVFQCHDFNLTEQNIIKPPDYPRRIPDRFFNPYDFNGGSVVAVAGDGFAAIGADTRLTSNNLVLDRNTRRLFQLTDKSIIGSCGCWADTLGFIDVTTMRVEMYRREHMKFMSVVAIAQMVSVLMYNRRFFPYYIGNVLVGLDSNNKGHVFAYDPIGHYERTDYAALGNGGRMIEPVLDNYISFKNRNIDPKDVPKMTKERAVSIISDAFVNIGEREIQTGDSAIICVITPNGIEEHRTQLRLD